MLVVNDIGSLLRSLELGGEFEQGRELLERIVSNGPLHGITTVMSSASEHAAPARMLGQFQQRIILHLDDRGAYRALGIEPVASPCRSPGRAITLPDLVEIQIGIDRRSRRGSRERASASDGPHGPAIVARTPDSVVALGVRRARPSTRNDGGACRSGSTPARCSRRSLQVHGPGGALILGDAGTGKSTVLTNIARCALARTPTSTFTPSPRRGARCCCCLG